MSRNIVFEPISGSNSIVITWDGVRRGPYDKARLHYERVVNTGKFDLFFDKSQLLLPIDFDNDTITPAQATADDLQTYLDDNLKYSGGGAGGIPSNLLYPKKLIFAAFSSQNQDGANENVPVRIQFENVIMSDSNYIDFQNDTDIIFKLPIFAVLEFEANSYRNANNAVVRNWGRVNRQKDGQAPTQYGFTLTTYLDGSNDDTPISNKSSFDVEANETIFYEFMRGTQGPNDGGLRVSDPGVAGWEISPSAIVTIYTNDGLI